MTAAALEWMRKNTVWLHDATAAAPVALLIDDDDVPAHEFQDLVSAPEREAAASRDDAWERRHLLLRRTLQRFFVATLLAWRQPLCDLPLVFARDMPPRLPMLPGLRLSFSTSGKAMMAAASSTHRLGIDIETSRPVPDALRIAGRFFAPSETAGLAGLSGGLLAAEFLKLWTIKEACLKATGKGVVYGLDAFVATHAGPDWSVVPPSEFGVADDWRLLDLRVPDPFIATLATYALPPLYAQVR